MRHCFFLPLVAALASPLSASGTPLLESRVGGLSLVGPATAHPASVFYNPATLTLLPGHHAFLDGTYRLGIGSAARRQTTAETGAPTAGSSSQDLREQFPQLFLGLTSDLGSETVVVSVILHTPYAYRYSYLRGPSEGSLFDPGAQGPTRYHAVDFTLFHLYVTPAASFKLADFLSVGVSFSYVFGLLDYSFVRDAALSGGSVRSGGQYVGLDDCGAGSACNYGADAAAEAVHVRGKSNSVAFALGVLGRPHPNVDIGLAYVSRVLGIGGDNIPAKGEAWVRRSAASLANAAKDPELSGVERDLSGRGTVSYSLPDMVHLGVTWRVRPRLALGLQLHWIHFGVHDNLDIRLSGSRFHDRPVVPDRIVHYRGFQDVWGGQLSAAYQLTKHLQLQAASLVQSSAVPSDAASPAAVDNLTVDSFVSLVWSLPRRVTLRVGYGLELMPSAKAADSVYSPSDMVACVDGHYDVELPQCQRATAGRGLASAAGEYSLMTHRFGMSISYDVW